MEMDKFGFMNFVGRHLVFAEKQGGVLLATTLANTELEKKHPDKDEFRLVGIFDEHDEPYVVGDRDDENGPIVGGKPVVLYSKECHGKERLRGVVTPAIYHRGANVFVLRSDEVLLPMGESLRGPSVSRPVRVGESYAETAVKGVEEAYGAQVPPWALQFLAKLPVVNGQSTLRQYYTLEDKGGAFGNIPKASWFRLADLGCQDLAKELPFRQDHLPALELLVGKYRR